MDINHVGSLANLKIDPKKQKSFSEQFDKILNFVSKISQLKISELKETSQVTDLNNILRNDDIDPTRVLTQEEALSNAKQTHNGYFVVDSILNRE